MFIDYKVQCRMCGRVHVLRLLQADVLRWQAGEMIQRVFTELDPGTRELMISQTCSACFDELFKE